MRCKTVVAEKKMSCKVRRSASIVCIMHIFVHIVSVYLPVQAYIKYIYLYKHDSKKKKTSSKIASTWKLPHIRQQPRCNREEPNLLHLPGGACLFSSRAGCKYILKIKVKRPISLDKGGELSLPRAYHIFEPQQFRCQVTIRCLSRLIESGYGNVFSYLEDTEGI